MSPDRTPEHERGPNAPPPVRPIYRAMSWSLNALRREFTLFHGVVNLGWSVLLWAVSGAGLLVWDAPTWVLCVAAVGCVLVCFGLGGLLLIRPALLSRREQHKVETHERAVMADLFHSVSECLDSVEMISDLEGVERWEVWAREILAHARGTMEARGDKTPKLRGFIQHIIFNPLLESGRGPNFAQPRPRGLDAELLGDMLRLESGLIRAVKVNLDL